MLQQTRVETVLPYFDRWMKRFPDFATLAIASEDDVLKSWEGLGYYRRANYLLHLARIVSKHSHPPTSYDAWIRLPGVGAYTAAAVTSIAFEEFNACVDGNVVRILARISGCEKEFNSGGDAASFFRPLAEDLLNPDHPGDHNQAMMELGAVICRRHTPKCSACPVRIDCASNARSDVDVIPRLVKPRHRKVTVDRLWIRANGSLLLEKRSTNTNRLAQIYELPGIEILGRLKVNRRTIAQRKRRIGNDQITEIIHQVHPSARIIRKLSSRDNCLWTPPDRLDHLTISGPHRRWITELLEAQR